MKMKGIDMIKAKELDFDYAALEPVISKETFLFHHDKHYIGYINKTNELIQNSDMADLGLEEIVLRASSDMVYQTLFNNAAQIYNHEIYFSSLTDKPEQKEVPSVLMEKIIKDFGSFEALKQELIDKGTKLFGSGYVWLVEKLGVLKVEALPNAETPLTEGFTNALMAIDVWEHAYYLDHQNLRAEYLSKVVHECLNWAFVAENYQKIKGE